MPISRLMYFVRNYLKLLLKSGERFSNSDLSAENCAVTTFLLTAHVAALGSDYQAASYSWFVLNFCQVKLNFRKLCVNDELLEENIVDNAKE